MMKINVLLIVFGILFETTKTAPGINDTSMLDHLDNVSSEEMYYKTRLLRSTNPFLFSAIRKNPARNYRPTSPGDLFDFLRDEYPLPPGND